MNPRLARLAARTTGVLVLLLLAFVAIACTVYPPQYVWRVLAWQDADADDYLRFPMRRIAPAAQPLPLERRPDAAAVEAAWKATGGTLPMERELASLGTQAFLVLRGNRVLYEGYFNGGSRENWVTSFSVAKSFLSTLVGIAVAEGAIASIDDPVTRYLPELRQRDARFERITLRHLLWMQSGLHYEEASFLHGEDAKTYYDPDLRRLALQETRVVGEPAQRFHYNNFHPLLLGLVLERATHMPVARYLEQRLWQRAGMAGDASWSLDSEASGFEKLESGLNARAEDFARFGLLMLRHGRVGAGDVVPPSWVDESTRPGNEDAAYYERLPWLQQEGRFYAGMWWGQRRAGGLPDFAARGNHGQMVFVSPANDVVIVRHGWRYGLPGGQWFERARAMADLLGGSSTAGSAPPRPLK